MNAADRDAQRAVESEHISAIHAARQLVLTRAMEWANTTTVGAAMTAALALRNACDIYRAAVDAAEKAGVR